MTNWLTLKEETLAGLKNREILGINFREWPLWKFFVRINFRELAFMIFFAIINFHEWDFEFLYHYNFIWNLSVCLKKSLVLSWQSFPMIFQYEHKKLHHFKEKKLVKLRNKRTRYYKKVPSPTRKWPTKRTKGQQKSYCNLSAFVL